MAPWYTRHRDFAEKKPEKFAAVAFEIQVVLWVIGIVIAIVLAYYFYFLQMKDQTSSLTLKAVQEIRSYITGQAQNLQTQSKSNIIYRNQSNQALGTSSRFNQLVDLERTAASGRDFVASEALITAVSRITPDELAAATPDETAIYVRSKATATQLAWSILQTRISGLGATPDGAAIEAIARNSQFLERMVPTPTSEQKTLLALGRTAAEQLTASDARLAALRNAAADWNARGSRVGRAALAPLASITDFDETRFGADEKLARSNLQQAEELFLARDNGLSRATKDRVSLFVEPTGQNEKVTDVARVMGKSLVTAGFHLASSAKEAALVITVIIEGIDAPRTDLTTGQLVWVANARLQIKAIWAADGSILLSKQIFGKGNDHRQEQAIDAALLDAIHLSIKYFEDITAN